MTSRIVLALAALSLSACDFTSLASGSSTSSSGTSASSTASPTSSESADSNGATSDDRTSGSTDTSSRSGTSGVSASSSSARSSSGAAESSSGPSCTCTATNACCDGCNPINLNGTCDDGMFCTVGDACNAQGVCTGATHDCTGQVVTGQCEAAACNEAENRCEARPGHLSESCDDHDVCSTATTCQPDGTCAGMAISCDAMITAPGCQEAMCHPTTGCFVVAINEAMDCDDGLFCTINTHCTAAGTCEGSTRDCSAAITEPECQHNATCDEMTNSCVAIAFNAGMPCDDDNFCSDGTTCQGDGTCGQGTPHDCSGITLAACQVASCNRAMARCEPVAAMDDVPCSDGNACTQMDKCQGGNCVGTSSVVCSNTECTTNAACNPATGLCASTPTNESMMCSAPNAIAAACMSGACEVSSCAPGYDDCTAAPGCETEVATSVTSCGACNNDCRANGRFAHARTDCRGGTCAFLGCDQGFQDADRDCTTGAQTCATGCEACGTLADGTFDIADDGIDNDCSGGDAVNTDTLGWYVDASFTESGTGPCAGGAVRGTRACPFIKLFDATIAATNAYASSTTRRHVYIAAGTYTANSTVFETTAPLILAGGYVRTASGPWTRNGGTTTLRSTGGTLVGLLGHTTGTAVLDRLTISQEVNASGSFVARKITAETTSPTFRAAAAVLMTFVESTVLVDTNGKLPSLAALDSRVSSFDVASAYVGVSGLKLQGTTLIGSAVLGFNAYNVSYVEVLDSTINGSIGPGHGLAFTFGSFTDSTITGTLTFGQSPYWTMNTMLATTVRRATLRNGVALIYATLLDSRIEGGRSTLDDCDAFGNRFTGSSLAFTGGSTGPTYGKYSFERNIVEGGRAEFQRAHLVANNAFLNGASASGEYTFKGQFISNFVLPGTSSAALTLSGTGEVVANNVFARGNAGGGVYAIAEQNQSSDPSAVRNNALVGFADTSLYFNEGSSALDDVGRVNSMTELSMACMKGGNVSLPTTAAAGLLSVDPQSVLVGRIGAGPLVNGGVALPYSCDTWTIPARTLDLASAPRTCGPRIDIGAYEVCP